MTNSDSIYYQTKADGNAFYAVSPRNLPILPYYIEIVPTNVLPTRAGVPSTGVPSSAVSPAISAAVDVYKRQDINSSTSHFGQ